MQTADDYDEKLDFSFDSDSSLGFPGQRYIGNVDGANFL